MKKFLSIASVLTVALLLNTSMVKADELTVNIDVKSGDSVTKVLGADVYALIDDQLVEITVSPDRLPFKANLKFGALRIKSFWATNKQYQGIMKEDQKEPTEQSAEKAE